MRKALIRYSFRHNPLRHIVGSAVMFLVFVSCSGTLPKPGTFKWNTELKEPVEICGKKVRSFVSNIPPDTANGVLRAYCYGSKDTEPTCTLIPMRLVDRVTTTADPVHPPDDYTPKHSSVTCERERDGFLIFDKIEIRAMGGYRFAGQEAVTYPDASGGVRYEPETFGFGRGGTRFTVGGELALYPGKPFHFSIGKFLSERPVEMHLGIMAGYWPVDGSKFIPITFHPRITWNNSPEKFGCCGCDAWYIFGDLGFVFFDKSGAPYTPLRELYNKRYVWGLGIGYEIAVSRDLDIGIDTGVRGTTLPLPEIDCCPDIPREDRNFVRQSYLIFLRAGITF